MAAALAAPAPATATATVTAAATVLAAPAMVFFFHNLLGFCCFSSKLLFSFNY
jgi:hypothetical protein